MYHKLIILILISSEFLQRSMGTSSNIDSGTDIVPIRNKSLQQKNYDNRPKTKMMKKPHELWLPPGKEIPDFKEVVHRITSDYSTYGKTLMKLAKRSRNLRYRWRTAAKRFEPYYENIFVCNVPRLVELYELVFNVRRYYIPVTLPELTEIPTNREFALTGFAREGSVISYLCSYKVAGSQWELKWALFRLNKLRTDFHDYATIKTWFDPVETKKVFSRLDLRVSSVFSPFAVYCFANNKADTPNADGKRCENDERLEKCCSLHPYFYEVYRGLPKPKLTMTPDTLEEGSHFKAECYAKSKYYFDTFTWVIVFANNAVIYPQSRDGGHLTKYNTAMYNITLDTKLNGTFQAKEREITNFTGHVTNIQIELTSTFEIENLTADHNKMQLLCFTGLLDYDDPDMTSCGDRSWCSESGPITFYYPTTAPLTTKTRVDKNTMNATHKKYDGTTTAYMQTTTETDSTMRWLIGIGLPFHIFFFIVCIPLMRRYSWRRTPHLKQNETVPDNAEDPGAQESVQKSDEQSITLTVP